MAGELRLFIPPPFTGWTLVDPYGPEDPVPASGPVMHYDTTLTSSGDGKIYAAVAGRLTIRTPGCSQGYPFVPLPPPPVVPFHSTSVELFLEPIALPRTLRAAASGFGNLRGFRYRNVDLQTLIDALADIVGAGALTVGPGPLRSPTQLLTEMLYGLRTVNVPVGHLLGSGSTNGAASGHRLVGFAAIADSGPIDPSHVYDELRDFVADGQPAVDAFVTLSPTQWPLIPPDAPFTTVLASASQNLYSMAVLRDFSPERNTNITAVQWRSRVIEVAEEGCLVELGPIESVGHRASTSFNAASPRLEWVLTEPIEQPIRSAV